MVTSCEFDTEIAETRLGNLYLALSSVQIELSS